MTTEGQFTLPYYPVDLHRPVPLYHQIYLDSLVNVAGGSGRKWGDDPALPTISPKVFSNEGYYYIHNISI